VAAQVDIHSCTALRGIGIDAQARYAAAAGGPPMSRCSR